MFRDGSFSAAPQGRAVAEVAPRRESVHQALLVLSGEDRALHAEGWSSREVLSWMVERDYLNLLEDFKDVNGAYLLELSFDEVMQEPMDLSKFPLKLRGTKEEQDAKLTSLRSLAHELKSLRKTTSKAEGSSDVDNRGSQLSSGQGHDKLDKWGRTVNIFQACHKAQALYYGTPIPASDAFGQAIADGVCGLRQADGRRSSLSSW